MKAHLMHSADGFASAYAPRPHEQDIAADLSLDVLLDAMSQGDQRLEQICRAALFSGLSEPADIAYRQRVLSDCLMHREVIREMHATAVSAVEAERRIWGFRNSPSSLLRRSVAALDAFIPPLKRLYALAAQNEATFRSEGLTGLCATLLDGLSEPYLGELEEHARRLRFHAGVLMSASLGEGNKGVGYVLRTAHSGRGDLLALVRPGRRRSYSFEVHPRDDAGLSALAALEDRALDPVANALAQSIDHVRDFFEHLSEELGFYVGCLNLYERLKDLGVPVCMPVAHPWSSRVLRYEGIYDVCLALSANGRIVGNDAQADGASLVLITGANSGGKSTLLRAIGLAHLMMRCGMFAPADSFAASVATDVFTHFIREEDESLTAGRLDEELARMSAIVDALTPGSIVLFNESFAATNEREGSEIARHVIRALREADVRVLFVTHLYDLAHSLFVEGDGASVFLRAERGTDGQRTYKVVEGEPLPTTFGEDLFEQLGGWRPAEGGKRLASTSGA